MGQVPELLVNIIERGIQISKNNILSYPFGKRSDNLLNLYKNLQRNLRRINGEVVIS